MSLAILIVITLVIGLFILAGAVSFPYVPMLFGVYGPAAKTLRGRLIVALLWLAPPVAVIGLTIAWSSATARYMALLPAVYLSLLWFIRPNKQDGAGPRQRFSDKQQNVDEQRQEMQYKWSSWLNQDFASALICFEIWSPNLAQAEKFRAAFIAKHGLALPIEIAPQRNGSQLLFVPQRSGVAAGEAQRELIQQQIMALIDLAWQHGCELLATEVEAELPASFR